MWNKNRGRCNLLAMSPSFADIYTAAPPQAPKQFTDEELKQQYGIHLATRLQTDETGKPKWADLDEDDDDDWAPEAVEWIDGTKSTLTPAEVPVAAVPLEPVMIVLKKETAEPQPTPQPKPILTALKRPTPTTTPVPTGPPKTILRPGAAQQAKQGGTTPNGTQEQRPSLVAKASASGQTKSPWAALPPVDKISPIVINPPPMPQPPSRFGHADPHGFDAMPQLPYAAREIAADTFDRSWKDNERGGRELFNSQSGRYEPAPEYRRGSARTEHAARQPAVLQRPSPQDSSPFPGPSAAFQTRSSGQDAAPWGRRRGSSVSAGSSLPRDRRMSVARPSDILSPQEEIHAPVFDSHDIATQVSRPDAAASSQSGSSSQPTGPQQTVPSAPMPDIADEVARQKKLMQEKRDLAIKRKKEEDEREEAARKERIRIKMETLGLPPLAPKLASTEAPAQKNIATQARTDVATPEAIPAETSPSHAPPASEQAQAVSTSQTEAQGQSRPVQIQIPAPVVPSPPKTEMLETESQAKSAQSTSVPLPLPIESPQLSLRQDSPPNVLPRSPFQQVAPSQAIPSAYSSPGEHKAHPSWKSPSLGTDAFNTWGNGSMASHASPGSNVWGAPLLRGIGNGMFENAYPRVSPHRHPNQSGGFPTAGAFGPQQPPRQSSRVFNNQSVGSPVLNQALVSEQQHMTGVDEEGRVDDHLGSSSLLNGVSPTPVPARPHQPGPIAPPQRASAIPTTQQQPITQRGVSAWSQYSAQADAQAELDSSSPRLGTNKLSSQPGGNTDQRWKETFKQTRVKDGWLGGPREVVGTEKTVHGDQPSTLPSMPTPAPPVSQTQQITSPQPPIGEARQRPGQENTVRLPNVTSSFPKAPGAFIKHADQQRPLAGLAGKPAVGPQTPNLNSQQSRFFPLPLHGNSPPPEESDHPVNDGDVHRPHVSLPTPKPTVKLPPALQANDAPQTLVPIPQRMPSYRGVQPLVQSHDWQARFNGLFGKVETTAATPPSPPTTPPKEQAPAPAVAPSTKAAMDIALVHTITTVSLPQIASASRLVEVEEDIVTKAMVDDMFDGELSFGSIPKVSLPRGARYAEVFTGHLDLPMSRPNSRFHRATEAQTQSKPETPINLYHDSSSTLIILLPLSKQPAKGIPFQRNHKPRNQSRKTSAQVSKGKRSVSETKENTATAASSGQALPARKTNSRQPSFQKSQATTTTVSPKATPVSNGQAGTDSVKAPAPRERKEWARPPRGRNPPPIKSQI